MASSLWGPGLTEDENETKELAAKAMTAVAATDALDHPELSTASEESKPKDTDADEIADLDAGVELTDDGNVPVVEDLPEVDLPDDAEEDKMGVREHAKKTIESELGKKPSKLFQWSPGAKKLMSTLGISEETASAVLEHTTDPARQIQQIQAFGEEKNLEKLRTGDFDDRDMDKIARNAGLHNELEEINRITASSMDPLNEKRKFLAMAAEGELTSRTQTKQDAASDLERKEQTVWGKIASGTLENSGYVAAFVYGSSIAGGLGIGMTAAPGASALGKIGVGAVNTMIGSAPASAIGAGARYQRLSKKDYQLDAEGELQAIDNNYGELRSMVQGGVGGFVENTVVEGLTDTAIELGCLGLSKIPGPAITHAPSHISNLGGIGGTRGAGSLRGASTGATDSSGEWKVTGTDRFRRPDKDSVWDQNSLQWIRRWLPGEKEAEAQQRIGDVKNSQLAEILGIKHSFEKDSAEQAALLNQEGKVIDAKIKAPPAGQTPALRTPFPTAPGGPTPPNAPTPPIGTSKVTITPAGQIPDLQKQFATILTSVSTPGSSPAPEVKTVEEQNDGGQNQLANLADAIAQESGGYAPEGPDDIMGIYANGGSVFGEKPKQGEGAGPALTPFALPDMDTAAGGSDAFAANEYSNYLGGMFGMFFNNWR